MIFPIGDDNTDRTSFPIVNVTLIAINVAVFVLLQGLGSNTDFTFAFSTVPAEIIKGVDLKTPDEPVRVNTPEGPRQVLRPGLKETPVPVYLTLLSSMFMHGGIAHLLGNMWFLWIFGDNMEDEMGHVGFLIFYLLAGLAAGFGQIAAAPYSNIPMVGASGAIAGTSRSPGWGVVASSTSTSRVPSSTGTVRDGTASVTSSASAGC